jgi:diacylglycerol kinase family enzyme
MSALADGGVPVPIVPCGTGNLLARNLGVPLDFAGALEVAFTGIDRPIDLGVLDAEPFGVGGCDSRLPCLLAAAKGRPSNGYASANSRSSRIGRLPASATARSCNPACRLHIGVAALPATVRCPQ